jgi:hypothetical protein
VCVKVSPDGDDDAAAASLGSSPFQTTQAAIDFADSHREVATNVCVASRPTCTSVFPYFESDGDLRMKNGISVFGGFESGGFTRCDPLSPGELPVDSAPGVLFDAEIKSPTRLDGFSIASLGTVNAAGISVLGARGVELANLTIQKQSWQNGNPLEWIGIDVSDATVAITETSIASDGDEYHGDVFGLRSVASRVAFEGTILIGSEWGSAYGVSLDDSPSSIVRAEVTVGRGAEGFGAVRVTGRGEGIEISDGVIVARGDWTSPGFAIRTETCAGEAPTIENNTIRAEGGGDTARIEAVQALGACHPVIVGNSISSGGNSPGTVVGVHCGVADGVSSRCRLIDNGVGVNAIRSVLGPLTLGVGILCDDGSCAEISDNSIGGLAVSGGCTKQCEYESYGLDLYATNVLVRRNSIRAGCADTAAGIRVSGSAPEGAVRIENNLVRGRSDDTVCGQEEDRVFYSSAITADAPLDVHSNTLYGGGSTHTQFGCSSAAVRGGTGTYRNNVLFPGICEPVNPSMKVPNPGSYYFTNSAGLAENNDFVGGTAPYGNFSADPGFADGFHLGAGSACIDTGTPTGAPLDDFDGEPRDIRPDVGADEFVPPG